MGRFLAAAIIVFATYQLAPVCARLPRDLTTMSGSAAAPVASTPADVAVPAAAPVAAVDVSTKAAEPPKPAAWPADKAAVTVSTYRMKRMFKIADGKGMVSVSVKNVSGTDAAGLKLSLSAIVGGNRAERMSANVFDLAASTSVYRGLRLDTATIDSVLAETPAEGTELRWDLTYKLAGEDAARCYVLRALPRVAGEAVEWKTLSQSSECEAKK